MAMPEYTGFQDGEIVCYYEDNLFQEAWIWREEPPAPRLLEIVVFDYCDEPLTSPSAAFKTIVRRLSEEKSLPWLASLFRDPLNPNLSLNIRTVKQEKIGRWEKYNPPIDSEATSP